MNRTYVGKYLDECLNNASKELNVAEEDLNYKIINDNHSFINKKVEIEVMDVDLYSSSSNNNLNYTEDFTKDVAKKRVVTNEDNVINNDENGVKVENGNVVVIEGLSKVDKEQITIKPCEKIKLFINGELCSEKGPYEITQSDKIDYIGEKIEQVKKISVNISVDKMKGYIKVEYKPAYVYKLRDKPIAKDLILKAMKVEKNYPEKYTLTEIKEILRQNKITEGIIYKNLIEACALGNGEETLIAEGISAIDDTPNEIKVLFDIGEKRIVNENSNEKIDYRNVYSISSITEGQVLAEIIPGKSGQDGKNICGEVLKKKTVKSRPIKIGDGCKVEGNSIIATKTGRPSSKNGILSVNSLYNIQDVDIKSGNIFFVGDVYIKGNVKEGMKVKSGNSLTIEKNVDISTIVAGGEINIKGSVIKSTVLTGQVDMEKKIYLEKLNEYKDIISKLISGVEKLNESSNNSKKISELVKILIENRYKSIPKLSLNIITHSICEDSDNNDLVSFIRSKMMGLNLSKIESIEDLRNLEELITNEIELLEDNMIIPADIYIGYCQDSLIKSTGNIIIKDKGQYVSNLTALNDIIFLRDDSVARGGVISARGNIKLGIVGSPSGVTTKLEVLQGGIITAKIAYSNTVFCFGERLKTLDVSSKDIKAYVNKEGEIIIEKFVL
ncbi:MULTISPECIES: DUF342 domain-containing protein [Clostridium]|uniref:DUF342 domain-containing protein n=1 Tax=Clostridium TaxID=1485 RepID=UPI001EF2E243|nr:MULTISPECIES: FapA family protein [Clostridium]